MRVTVSVENECKFCDWKITDKAKPSFLCEEDGKVTAFCPMCGFELAISSQILDWREECIDIRDQKAKGIGIVDKKL